ncbi:MAG: TrmH family RNA methyltransferase [Phycisphaerales bacterium]
MPTPERIERIQRLVAQRQRGVVVLEDIHDRYNAAAVYRSCDAFGIQAVHLVFDRERTGSAGFSPTAAGRVASGSANQWLDFHRHAGIEPCYAALRARGYLIVATALGEDAVPIDRFDFAAHADIALVFGNELDGLSEPARQGADARIMVPMRGVVQSLNLSVTVAICLHEMTRQRRAAGMERFTLPEADRVALEAALIERRASGETNHESMAQQIVDPRETRKPKRRKRRSRR